MKTTYFLITYLLINLTVNAQVYVMVNASEEDAKIYVDGKHLGTGSIRVKIPRETCVVVKVDKQGYLSMEQTYCNKKGTSKPPKSQFFNLKRDDAIEASTKSDQANVDFTITVNSKFTPKEAWKVLTQVVTDYFDAIEISDQETSYLRTAWTLKTYSQNTIRTRLIVKMGSISPYSIKVKIVSEYSGEPETNPKSDEKFKEWDRILRKYQTLVDDLRTRLS